MASDGQEFTAICAQLSKDEEFRGLDTNDQRIDYIFKNVKPLQAFREDITKRLNQYIGEHSKNLKKTQAFREEGDNHMVAKSYGTAIQCYTQALLYAPFPTTGAECTELQKAYTARSLAFFRIGHYEDALFDTEKSLFLGSSLDMLSQKASCLRALRRFTEAKSLVDAVLQSREYYAKEGKPEVLEKLDETQELLAKEVIAFESRGRDEEPEREQDYDLWIHQKFEVKATDSKGRHLVAKEKIPKGEAVVVEKPESVVLSAQNMRSFCTACFKRVGHQFWPCVWCSEVVFCDRTCHDRGIRDFHQYECKMTGLLSQSPAYQAFRIVNRIGAEYAFKTAQDSERPDFDRQKWVNRFYARDCPVVYRLVREEQRHHFEGLLALVDHNEKVTPEEAVRQALNAIEMAVICEHKKSFVTYEEKTFVEFAAFLVKIYRKAMTNSFGYNIRTPDGGSYSVGSCTTVYASLVNHSCAPNMNWHFFEDKIILTTARDVEDGEELTICYGPNAYMPLEQRQVVLRNHYHFSCGCDVCVHQVRNYPALKCLQCEGPALFVANPMRDDNNACLKCGTVYPNMKEVVNRIAFTRLEFEAALKTVDNIRNPPKNVRNDAEEGHDFDDQFADGSEERVEEEKTDSGAEEEIQSDEKSEKSPEIEDIVETEPEAEDIVETEPEIELSAEKMAEIESCLEKAEESLQTLIGLHFSECGEMLDLSLKIAKTYMDCGKSAEAVAHTARVYSAIDWSKCGKSCRHMEALLVVTDAYYQHLKDQSTDGAKNEWKQCFKSFSALKESYKALKEDSEAVKRLTIGGQPVGDSTHKFTDTMREKRAHLSALKEVYKSLFAL